MQAPAFLAFEEDIQSRSWLDWLRAHTSFMKPLHRYEGTISLTGKSLVFEGWDIRDKEPISFKIARNQLIEIYMGFDDIFTAFETRSLGVAWQPIRVTAVINGEERHLYMIINYRLGFCDNRSWFELLKKWGSSS